ncbi:hypothetical protein RBU49_04105 [Clostridium sp. MB40-C1]|uniref:hypothetical protein n=1 Tax=Clostridiaceae TaxID=31979 RepID=UPI0027E18A67|nr:hypothetical protein [Clostridium sp. MB40-C1]WMJ81446.1 hypothetical protein RBU49_04105 [Clostridium sp. MB40-C1]
MNVIKELIEGITQDLIKYLCEEENYKLEDAMETVYNSIVFEKLTDAETGLYRESASYVYELLKDEIASGKIIQKEE